jgi:hypothetical protein
VPEAASNFKADAVGWVFEDKNEEVSKELQKLQTDRADIELKLPSFQAMLALGAPCGAMTEPLTNMVALVREAKQVLATSGLILACAMGMEIFVNQGSYADLPAAAEAIMSKIQADFLKDNMKALPKELKARFDAIAQGKKRKNRSS